MKRIAPFCVVLVAVAMLGCGNSGGVSKVKVTGTVTLPNGKPLTGGRVDFHSSTGMASGVIEGDGNYEALDVPAGEKKVSITNAHLKDVQPAPPGLAAMPGDDQRYVQIDPKFGDPGTSGLSVTITSEDPQTYDIQLK